MIELKNVSAGYGNGHVLHNISFTLHQGASLSILGPNGCGKSTLLKCLAGILPFEGSITIEGKEVSGLKRRQLARTVALMGQTMAASFEYTVFDTVMQGRYPHIRRGLLGQPTRKDREIAENAMEVTGVAGLRGRSVTALSGGQLQRVFLARTLAQQPSVILLDEPTNHLDLKYQAELLSYLRGWAAQPGHTVVGVFHDLNLALSLSDEVLLLREGRMAAFGPLQGTLTPTLLREVYDMDVAGYMKEALSRWEEL